MKKNAPSKRVEEIFIQVLVGGKLDELIIRIPAKIEKVLEENPIIRKLVEKV